jgi:hypothetical protein
MGHGLSGEGRILKLFLVAIALNFSQGRYPGNPALAEQTQLRLPFCYGLIKRQTILQWALRP